MEERRLGFLESLLVSAGTGAVTGAACAVGNVDEKQRNIFTGLMVDLALETGNRIKQKDREGYIPGL